MAITNVILSFKREYVCCTSICYEYYVIMEIAYYVVFVTVIELLRPEDTLSK